MAVPSSFDGDNGVLSGEKNSKVAPVSARIEKGRAITCWKVTAEELDSIIQSKKIWLITLGTRQPESQIDIVKPNFEGEK